MAKKKLAHKLFSTMLSLLFHGRRPLSRAAPTTSAQGHRDASCPVVHQRATPPMAVLTAETTLVVDVDTALLRSPSLFPYFMLVALEAGGFLRGLVLLLLYPLVRLMSRSAAVKAMAAVSFCGLRASRFRAGRAVLPKWFMEDVAAEGFEAVRAPGRRVCVTGMPRVMVEGFLREHMEAEAVVGREMKLLWGFYTGLMEEFEDEDDHEQVVMAMEEERKKKVGGAVVGFSGSPEFLKHPLSRCCKEIYVVSSEEKSKWRPLPRDKYPKPMVFHDGRLAFRPTAADTVAMFAWLPLGAALGAARLAVALTVPYRYSTPILAATGMSWRLKGERPPLPSGGRGQLFVCNHRTLIDPVYVSVALDRQVRAVSYSLSRLSELISPIGRTVRLTRDRDNDGRVMARLLDRGDLVVVCPEGTTCREPYLLRFSPLFAELSDDVVPVGIAVETSMFYATTAGGLKCFDPLYYMANPRMCYTVQFLDKVDTSPVKARAAPSTDMANLVQRKMGDALGYGCTMLTRKDKYLMLAGNDGIVRTDDKSGSAAAGKKKTSTEKNN
ncbi:probable glycerol-3-phosphate acyltransferase 3 [Phragmites australis]|uniref:probable glycerol-3-phosphate acyltransferase 3 n=1 Tax=Phragmites australis TaxID=29695 RepID=UPI002D7681A9|nr:probable glycerol-3-phosphate acyltransferase 3 [Phragmites australis]